jgi:hypothetical protein
MSQKEAKDVGCAQHLGTVMGLLDVNSVEFDSEAIILEGVSFSIGSCRPMLTFLKMYLASLKWGQARTTSLTWHERRTGTPLMAAT